MKAHLLYSDRDFDINRELPPNSEGLTKDLELDILFDAMASGDELLRNAARTVVLDSATEPETITYRQGVLADCLRYPSEVRGLYQLIVESIDGEKEARWWGFGSGRFPSSILTGALRIVAYYADELRKLRNRARELSTKFTSTGLVNLCSMLTSELSDDYLARVQAHLKQLEFRHGVLISADIAKGLKGASYVIRKPNEDGRPWLERIFSRKPDSYTYTVPERDEAGARALSELRDRGVNPVANALAQSADHIRDFYSMLRTELAFYVGCINLQERLADIGEPICLPRASEATADRRSFDELYDVCLALTLKHKVTGNDVNADGRRLVIVTGANHGGKSTFLRSVGIAQLMMQSGMFVCARSYDASLCTSLFTHFRRQEDAAMESGKFDEELKRMSEIADGLSPHALVLFNESFAATNEREGSEIARQIVHALVENEVSVYFVSHQYDFTKSTHDAPPASALFLRAERDSDGSRSYKLIQAPPLETSYGRDLYQEVFEKPSGMGGGTTKVESLTTGSKTSSDGHNARDDSAVGSEEIRR